MKTWCAFFVAAFAVTLSLVSPVLGQGRGDHGHGGSPPSPHLAGAVTNLQSTSTGSTFTLLDDGHHSVSVTTTSTTTITNRADSSNAILGNGLYVSVTGTRSNNSNAVTATAIVVDNSVFGTVSNLQITASANSFDLIYAPNQTLHIETAASTTVTNASDGSVATLTEGQKVKVKGTYDAVNAVFTATAIVVNDREPIAHNTGTVSNLQTANGVSTFTLRDRRRTVHVTTTATTTVINFSDNSPATLANGQNVHVSGSYDETTQILTATSIVVNDRRAQDHNQYVQGAIVSIDAAAGTFVVSVEGACVHATSTTVTVAVTSSTVFTTRAGITAAFSDLTVGTEVKAEGAFDATTQTLTATTVRINR